MNDTYCRFRFVDMLTACARTAVSCYFKLVHIELEIEILRLRKHRNGYCRCLDASLRLRFRYALYAMHTGLKLETRIRALTVYHKGNFLKALELGLICVYQLGFESRSLSIHIVHTVQIICEKCSLVASGAASYLDNNILVIIRILRQKQYLQLFGSLIQAFTRIGFLLLCKLAKLFVR